MAEISAQLVKELRERTGAGMMDCKRALQETNGDMEAAIVLLREKGMAQAAKRAGRETTEGMVGYRLAEDGSQGHDGRRRLRDRARVEERRVPRVSRRRCSRPSTRTASAPRRSSRRSASALSAKLGENIAVAGAARFEAVDGGRIAAYAHPPANKLGVLVQVRGGDDELGRKLAMHIAASDPQWIARDDVPAEAVAAEREIYANSDEVQSKPEQAREKIVDGMLEQALLRRERARRPGRGSTTGEDGRRRCSQEAGRRGARVRALLARADADERPSPRRRSSRRRPAAPASGACC